MGFNCLKAATPTSAGSGGGMLVGWEGGTSWVDSWVFSEGVFLWGGGGGLCCREDLSSSCSISFSVGISGGACSASVILFCRRSSLAISSSPAEEVGEGALG